MLNMPQKFSTMCGFVVSYFESEHKKYLILLLSLWGEEHLLTKNKFFHLITFCNLSSSHSCCVNL